MSDSPVSSPAPGATRIAAIAVTHALVVVVFLSWRYGGMEPLARTIAAALCAPAPLVTGFAWRAASSEVRRSFLRFGVPLLVLTVIVGVSALNPSMRLLFAEGQPDGMIPRVHRTYLPSSVWPADTLRSFAFNAGLILVGLNLFLAAPRRELQRLLLAAFAINAALLAAAGSIFKLARATAIFGAFPSPNPNFFATFFYYNHWGAFALLGASAAAGLALHYYRRAPSGAWQHTPAPALGVLTLILLASLPLAGGRASTAAGTLLALFLALRLLPERRSAVSRRLQGIAIATALLAVALAAGWLARDSLQKFQRKTSTQIADFGRGGIGDARLTLYRDTWKLVEERPIFGWGWHSFRYAFYRVQSSDFRMETEQRGRSTVLDAHNDWLQLLAETGVAGVLVSLAALFGVARAASRRWWSLAPSAEIVAGLVCVALLALVDFPFACPAIVAGAWVLLMAAASIAHDRSRRAH